MNQKKTMIMQTMRLYKLLLFILISPALMGQQFTHQARIQTVEKSGMYLIHLSPEIRSYSKPGLFNIRVLDSLKREVPYILKTEDLHISSLDFVEYPVLKDVKNKHTFLIIQNKAKAIINNISLSIANADADKFCTISGSNDQKQWYIVAASRWLFSLHDVSKTNVFRSVEFPPVDYSYFKIDINDSLSAPLNILKAGYFKNNIILGKLSFLTTSGLTIKTEDKKTIINLVFINSQQVDRLSFIIKSPRFFKRNASLLVKRSRIYKKRTDIYWEVFSSFELSSDQENHFDFNRLNEKELRIIIENGDNPTLDIKEIRPEQLNAYLICDLKAGQKYNLVTGNENLSAPDYDLAYFSDKIATNPPEVHLDKTELIAKKTYNTQKVIFWQQSWFMWLCISVAALIIFFFSFSLLKDMQKK